MRKYLIVLLTVLSSALFPVYKIGETISAEDNITWLDNFGYSSNILNEVYNGRPVMIFFGKKSFG